MNYKLKFRIIERYRTQARFAVACGKGENWISRIITEREAPTEEDKEIFRRKLRIKNIDDYFPVTQEKDS
jgi:hypothetical protein